MLQNARREKFIKLAESRTQTALSVLRKIGNLSNSRAYEYTEKDVKQITRALKEAVSDIEKKFSSAGETRDRFTLSGDKK